MSHNLAKTALLVTAAVTLSGCAQMGHFGNSMWGYTKSAANFVASPVTKLLRSAPEQDYVFENGRHSQQAVKMAFAQDGYRTQGYHAQNYPAQNYGTHTYQPQSYQTQSYQAKSYQTHTKQSQGYAPRKDLVVPQLAQLPVPQTSKYQGPNYHAPHYHAPQYQAPAYTPDSYQQDYSYADYPASPPTRVVEAAPRNTSQVTDEISFVKMGGGSDMQDWATCEVQAGGFVTVVQGGYLINPGFESCMRTKGYKPESEVADQLSL